MTALERDPEQHAEEDDRQPRQERIGDQDHAGLAGDEEQAHRNRKLNRDVLARGHQELAPEEQRECELAPCAR